MSAQLLSTSEGATLILTLSNPEHKNALGPEMYAAGVEALSVAESSPEIKSVVITGEGALFSAGGNLQRLNNNCLLYTSPSPRDRQKSRMPSSA